MYVCVCACMYLYKTVSMSVTRFIATFGYVINKSIYYYSYSTEGGGIGAHGMHTFVCMYVCMNE